jgi:trans-aconitate methyltransferase
VADDVLGEQIEYYRQRAGEYDATSYVDVTAAAERIDRMVADLALSGSVVELACGTGMWTRALAAVAADVTAIDSAPEALAIARQRCPDSVRLRQADLFSWRPDRRYDVVFFAFWLSHVPSARLAAFFATIDEALAPGGRVLIRTSTPAGATANTAPTPIRSSRCDSSPTARRTGS